MSRSYANSTVEVIEALHNGLRVETGIANVTDAPSLLFQTAAVLPLFNVYGSIRINLLFGEVTTLFGAGAAVGMFRFTSSSPVITVAAMSIDCASVAALVKGARITLQGDLVGTAPDITGAAGVSYWPVSHGKMVIGQDDGVGFIELKTATGLPTSIASGAMSFTLCYSPVSEGAYATPIF
jgi:hypothetical protein